ncbi:MAG: spore germination protein [Clostridia bacterium]|nr:spore germination protein [Clostridia bacterium]
MNKILYDGFDKNLEVLCKIFPSDTSADIIKSRLAIGNKNACICHINGMLDTENMVKIHSSLLKITDGEIKECKTIRMLAEKYIPFTDYKASNNFDTLITAILSAQSVLIIDGFGEALILDTKKYPTRSIEEPEKNKTMRGPRDGFSESLLVNTALVRRRIKSTALAFERFEIGSETKTQVMLGYMRDKADEKCVEMIRDRLSKMTLRSLTLTQQTLSEELFGRTKLRRLNPFPKVRFIERPDTAASMLIEGKIMILCDTTPTAIFLPITVYDFIEETDDYYFPPLTGSYLRIIRISISLLSVFLSPVWLLLTMGKIPLPEALGFITDLPECSVPIWIQLIMIEITVDALKIASLNTPNTIANSLGVVSGLLLGDFAIQSGWFVPQAILYSSICAIANFIPTNYEIGYCYKFWRMSMIICVRLAGLKGLIINTAAFVLILALNKTADQRSYLFPFLPFNKNGFKKFFIRTNHGKENNY